MKTVQESNSPTKLLFYNDFILLFIEKYPQKYPLFFLLPPKKPSFVGFVGITTPQKSRLYCGLIPVTLTLINH